MYVGRLVEIAETGELFGNPRHPYTEALLSAVPIPDPRLRAQRIILEGDVADPSSPPPGCYFHPRCQYAGDDCSTVTPTLIEIEPGHSVACHRPRELTLKGLTGGDR
jgi:peptide/nickel transport system ATP-binding protein